MTPLPSWCPRQVGWPPRTLEAVPLPPGETRTLPLIDSIASLVPGQDVTFWLAGGPLGGSLGGSLGAHTWVFSSLLVDRNQSLLRRAETRPGTPVGAPRSSDAGRGVWGFPSGSGDGRGQRAELYPLGNSLGEEGLVNWGSCWLMLYLLFTLISSQTNLH